MKKILLSCLLVFSMQNAFAQDCYQTFFDQGVEAFDMLDFEKAIRQFNAAKICDDKPDNNEVDAWIVKTQSGYIDAIRAAKDEAVKLKVEALALRSFVKGQEREFKSFYKEAIDEYSSAVRMIPVDTLFREQRAQLAMSTEVEEYLMAKDDLTFLIQNGNPNKRSGYEDNLAYVLEQLNDFNGAITAQKRAEEMASVEQKKLYNSKVARLKDERSKGVSNRNPSSKSSGKAKNSFIEIKDGKNYQGCDLQIKFLVNGKTLKPQSNGQIRLDRLPVGTYQYEISGTVSCPSKPSWPALGKGTISIRANAAYSLYWKLTKYKECEMWVSNY